MPLSPSVQPAKKQDSAPEKRGKILLLAFIGIIVGAVFANLLFSLTQLRQNILDEKRNTAHKMVRTLVGQTGDSMNAVELALQATTHSMQLVSKTNPDYNKIIHSVLDSNANKLPFVRAMWILDAKGNMIHDSQKLPGRYNLADRVYFQVHRDNPSHGLYIDKPILSKHGVWFFGISQRINRSDGGFDGVIVAAFEPKYLQQLYESIQDGKDGVVALMGIDGTLFMRSPNADAMRGNRLHPLPEFVNALKHADTGSYRSDSAVDGVTRQYFYHRVPGRSLTVLYGLGEKEMLAAWYSSARTNVAASFAFLLAILWLGYLALHEFRRRSQLHQALRTSESALAQAQGLAQIGSWQLDLNTRTGYWSDEMFRLFNLNFKDGAPPLSKFLQLVHPSDRQQLEDAVNAHKPWSGELRSNPELGPVRYFRAHSAEIRDETNQLTALAGTLQDVSERHQAEEKIRLAAQVFEHMRDGVMVISADLKIVAVNASFEQITGYGEKEILGSDVRLLYSSNNGQEFYDLLEQSLTASGHWRGEIWSRRKNGGLHPVWLTLNARHDSQNRRTGFVGVFTDLSEIREANQQLEYLINHDPLTRLPNRSVLNDRLQLAIDSAPNEHGEIGVLLLNLDRLQRINDSIGHEAGDMLLQEMAQRLRTKLHPGDTLARLGSDEFVVVIPQFEDTDDIITRTQQLLEAVALPCRLMEHEVTVTASIGITIYPYDGKTPGDLLKNADTALSHVKHGNRNGMRFYTAEMNERAVHWMSLEHHLRGALARNEFQLCYQPQVCLENGKICGAEALIRWRNPVLGDIPPADFIPLAEDTGLILAIGEWVIRTACAQNKAWQDTGMDQIPIAVNVSAHQIIAGDLPSVVRSALNLTGLAPQFLSIELTESVLLRETETAMKQIEELRRMGLTVALDDFGTGYSSLSYLSRFMLDKLKIDQCFIRDITVDSRSAAIANATIALAHGLGMIVIAEGVENEEQLLHLRQAGCDEIQGFLISKPLPTTHFEKLMNDRSHFNAKTTLSLLDGTLRSEKKSI